MINDKRGDEGQASDPDNSRPPVHEDFDEAPRRVSLLWLVSVSGLGLLCAVSFLWSILRATRIV
jgi:hypothetical protein